MFLKSLALFLMGAAVGYVIYVKLLDIACELRRELYTRI